MRELVYCGDEVVASVVCSMVYIDVCCAVCSAVYLDDGCDDSVVYNVDGVSSGSPIQ